MIQAGSLYKQLNTNLHNSVFVLHIPSLETYLSTEWVMGLASNAVIASRPALPRQQVELLEGRTSFGGINVNVINRNGLMETLLSNSLLDRDTELYQGFRDLPWEEYLLRHTGRIKKTGLGGNINAFGIQIDGRLAETDKDIFDEESFQNEPATVVGTGFASKTWTFTDPDTGDIVKLTLSDSEAAGKFDRITVVGNPFSIALAIMLSGGSSTRDENAFPPWAGCAIDEDKIDFPKWTNAKINWDFDFEFILGEAYNAKDFIESEVMKIFAGYLIVSGDGKIGCRTAEIPRPTDDLPEFTDRVITDTVDFIEDSSLLLTGVRFSLDYNGEDFETNLPPVLTEKRLFGPYRTERVHYIPSRGLKTLRNGMTVVKVVTAALFRRFGIAPRRVGITSFGSMNLVESGDHAVYRSTLAVNADIPKPLGVNVSRYFEVITTQYSNNAVDIEGMDLTPQSVNEGRKSAIIAPDATADYPTGDQRYAFVSDVDGEMGNGDPGYVLA